MTTTDLRVVQEGLESQWLTDSINTYKSINRSIPFSATQVGNYLLGKALSNLEEAIVAYREEPRATGHPFQKAVFLCLSSSEIAALALKYTLDVAFEGQSPDLRQPTKGHLKSISTMSLKIGSLLEDQFNWTILRKTAAEAYDHMMDFLKGKSRSYRHRTLRWWKTNLGQKDIRFSTRDRGAVGYEVLRMTIESTGLFETARVYSGNRLITTIVPTPEVLTKVLNNLEVLSQVNPRFLPMVIPPEPWDDDPMSGGYLTLKVNVISHYRENAEELHQGGYLKSRYSSLNKLQAVPWEINTQVLALMEEAYKQDHRAVPLADLSVTLPEKPWSTTAEYKWLKAERPEVIQEWAKATATIYTEFYAPRTVGQRMGFLRTLAIAKRFKDYETIWFPWRMDYRGRFYPVPHTLNPQGSDYSKALLRFHTRTPLTPSSNPEAWRLYLIQGAGLFGFDKAPFDERVAWNREHHQDILAVARSPWDTQWWTEADKPWCFLAWCLEYAALVSGQQDYTQLPVSWDGKCNGLQHLSIAVRDERTASLVSLVPCDKPSDIYTEVVKATEALIPPDNRWKGQITRSLVKRPTMTTPYNVTTMGMGDQIKETLISEGEENYATKETNLAAVELRDYVSSGIRGLLGLTMDLMTWYSEVARAFTKAGTTLYWDLPDGFRVIQDIPKTKTKKLKLRGQTVVINYRVNLDSQDTRRNMSAFSPNITHSLDATHMSLWLSKLPEEVPVMAIHDSFGLPAPHMVTYGPEILKTFVELYRGFSPVAELQRVAADNDIQIPEAPKSGGLSLDSQVALATYAFA